MGGGVEARACCAPAAKDGDCAAWATLVDSHMMAGCSPRKCRKGVHRCAAIRGSAALCVRVCMMCCMAYVVTLVVFAYIISTLYYMLRVVAFTSTHAPTWNTAS